MLSYWRMPNNRFNQPCVINPEAAAADPRVVAALGATGCAHYRVTSSGACAFRVELEGDRGHCVFIEGQTVQVGFTEMRCVWAYAYTDAEPLSAGTLSDLLAINAGLHLGGWQVTTDEGSGAQEAVLALTLPADASALELVGTALHVARHADEVEAALNFGTDRL